MTSLDLRNGDCLELMKTIPDASIDLLICDLPYGETNCKWDCVIDMDDFWKEFRRIRKSKRTACIHFCSTKFGYSLIKSWEKGFKMDMVWKKRNKTGGLQSRHRPMRNHEMVYFFYEQAPKYNRDKYHKRIQEQKTHDIKKEGEITAGNTSKMAGTFHSCFEPNNPGSVLEEENAESNKLWDYNKPDTFKLNNDGTNQVFTPALPVSVVEIDEPDANKAKIYKGRKKGNKDEFGYDEEFNKKPFNNQFDPKLPASVIEEEDDVVEEKDDVWGQKKWKSGGDCGRLNEDGTYKLGYEPPNPASVVEEDEPVSMFESTKVFIGKRHHQTEKPQDILEFFLKYWTDEGQTVLDPTMGSGSTACACKKLKRNFIGFELDATIYENAVKRVNKHE